MKNITLSEFLFEVKNSINASFPLKYWITAEISSLRVNPNSGHCYVDLVEKDDKNVLARTGGVIWKGRFEYICKKFSSEAGNELKSGLKVMLHVDVMFHEVYGFKLNINDIDPSYTAGEFALHRKRIAERLAREGLLERNKSVTFPPVPQRIAVISSASAAGYEDFVNTLGHNSRGYGFAVTLFPAYMQGGQTEKSVVDALGRIALDGLYDLVVIIRGGGDGVDLHSFDSYDIGKEIALFPIPVITGIGHKRDETIADMAAHTRLISPTAVAEFLIGCFRSFDERLDLCARRLAERMDYALHENAGLLDSMEKDFNTFAGFFIRKKKQEFDRTASDFRNSVAARVASHKVVLRQIPVNISKGISAFIKSHSIRIDRHDDRVTLMNPLRVLKRGYTLTLKGGKIIAGPEAVNTGDVIETRFYKGSIESRVKKVLEVDNEERPADIFGGDC